MEQRHLFMTAGHLGFVRLWDSRCLHPATCTTCLCTRQVIGPLNALLQ